MKGAIAEPCATTSNRPKSNIIKIIGNNQNFFLALKNIHSSFSNDILLNNFL